MPTNSERHIYRDEDGEIIYVSTSEDEAVQNASAQEQSPEHSSDDAEAVANALSE